MPRQWKKPGKTTEQPSVTTIDRDQAKSVPGAKLAGKVKRKATSVYLNSRELEAVTAEADRRGESVSDFIRQTLQRRLKLN